MRQGFFTNFEYEDVASYLKMLNSIKYLISNYVQYYHDLPNCIALHPKGYDRINRHFIDYCNADGEGYTIFGCRLIRSEDLQKDEFIIF